MMQEEPVDLEDMLYEEWRDEQMALGKIKESDPNEILELMKKTRPSSGR